jgi:choline-sulfatase
MRRAAAVAVVSAALLAAWVGVARPRWASRIFRSRVPKNLLLVSIDTLRADHLGSYGYAAAQTPRLDALARGGLRFERAMTVTPLTLPAHSSLMTGTFPTYHGVRDNGGFYLSGDQVTLATVLRGRGFRTGGFVGAFVLDRRWGIAQGFERFFDDFNLDDFKETFSMDAIRRPGAQVVDEALKWIRIDEKRPFFAWVHLYDPHSPYQAPEPYPSRFPRTVSGAYDAGIAYADAQVGRLLDALDLDRRLDETIVVVVGDHGEMLGEHGEQTHGFFIYDAVLHVPLIVSGPGVPARAIPDQVRIVDVMPTVLDLLKLATPSVVQGVSLMPLVGGKRLNLIAYSECFYPRYHYGWSELRAVQDGRLKYIRAPSPELYDLGTDPREAENRARVDATRLQSLDRALDDFQTHTASAEAARGPRTIDAETEERLAALGYVESASRRSLEDRPRSDPKDKIDLYRLLKKAGGFYSEGSTDEAIATVGEALARDPEIVEAYVLLGSFLRKSGRLDEAIAAYRQALVRDGEHERALVALAVAYKDSGRLDEARVGLERARKIDPRSSSVLWHLADLFMLKGDPRRAEEVIREALAYKVDEHRFLLKLGETQIQAKRFDEAEKSLKAALEKRPGLATAHFNLGLVYEETGRFDDAIASYKAEVESNAHAYRASFNLAKLLQERGQNAEALAYFRKTVQMQPEFGTAQLYLAKALLDAGDLKEAETWARSGLSHKPDHRLAPLGHYVLSDVYNRLGRTSDADREVAEARRLQRGT